MKTTKYQNNLERSILVGLIVNDEVVSRIVTNLKSETKPFRSKWSDRIYGWCRDYFSKYGKAPRKHIQGLFESYAESSPDEDSVGLIEKLLSSLDDDYKTLSREINADFLVDQASRHFQKVQITNSLRKAETALGKDDLDEAAQLLASFTPVSFSSAATMKALTDLDRLREAFDSPDSEPLVRYPGALGQFFGAHLCRDAFISFLAPDKRGKSFFMLDLAWRAAIVDKRKVVYFSVGDLSEKQMWKRIGVRAARWPMRDGAYQWPCEVRIPKAIKKGRGKVSLKTISKEFSKPLSGARAEEAVKEAWAKTASSSSLLQFECHPNSTMSVADIDVRIEAFIREDWVPDVVVVDYADILAHEPGVSREDFRHKTNETWKALRRISQKYHILVVTATQSNALAYGGGLLSMKNFSEDKRKLSHVTGMVGINQTDKSEKDRGIFHLNWIVLREGAYHEQKCVTVAGSLALANPAMVSTW